ncbi:MULTISPECIES: YhcH/YjgK/YiaL family protein [unclassified Helicobacter]|uniref:YhcH/YjgK/YiaL family protein n=1 Tax=unclassified Helicobacter TaxID=2593540 RepID=UPI000CF19B5E|nr:MULTISPECIES: YhcH/YjgK/YiaL family protein [unclassified Helicobacter]
MAIIGNLYSLSHLFKKTTALEHLYSYLYNASDKTHSFYKRILSLHQGESKINLDFGMIAIEQTYTLKDPKEAFYESHLKYVDFQLVIQGEEYFRVGDLSHFQVKDSYNPTKDLITYTPKLNHSLFFLQKNDLAIFFEYDVHAGGLYYQDLNHTHQVYKTVVKVPKELLKLKL